MGAAVCRFAFEIYLRKGHSCRWHAHECVEIVVNLSCGGRLWQDGREYGYAPQTAFVYRPGGEHRIENRRPGWQLCVGVHGGRADRLRPGVFKLDESAAASTQELRRRLAGEGAADQSALDLLAGLLTLDVSRLAEAPPEASPSPSRRAAEYIDRHFAEPFGVAELAERLYLSPDYLRQLFRAEFGESPLRFLLRKRLENAARLLRTTDLPIQIVGERCGIENQYYFSRVFRKFHGCSPSEYRHSADRKDR